jgi:hypothetical protein
MSEIILFIAVIGLIIIMQIIKNKFKKATYLVVSTLAAAIILVLVWFTHTTSSIIPKIVLSALVLVNLISILIPFIVKKK